MQKPPDFSGGFVTALGFKPKTPSSVVRYSIQLSYAAIFLVIGAANIFEIPHFPKEKVIYWD
jgi:hypothetical protein